MKFDCEQDLRYIDTHLQFYRYEEAGLAQEECENFCSYEYVLAFTASDGLDMDHIMYFNKQFPNCECNEISILHILNCGDTSGFIFTKKLLCQLLNSLNLYMDWVHPESSRTIKIISECF